MVKSLKAGWLVINSSWKVFLKYPKLLIPLLFTWVLYAPVLLYLKFGISNYDSFLIIVLAIFFFSLIISLSCAVLLELIRQLESSETINILKAISKTFTENIFRVLALSTSWAIIWLLITTIQAIVYKFTKHSESSASTMEFNPENAAKVLANYREFSITKDFFRLLNKGIRMIIFLILPGEIWSKLGFLDSIKKGMAILKIHFQEFATGFVISELAMNLVMLPAIIIFLMSKVSELPDYVWYSLIVYIAFAWSFTLYLEQMICAELYLWNLKWEKVVDEAQIYHKELPKLIDIPKPSILDDVNHLVSL